LSATRLEVSVGGGSLAAIRLRTPDERAPLALAIHGITSSSQTWVAVARALADQAAGPGGARPGLVAVDLRGRGRSGALAGPFGIDAHVQDMLAVLDHCGIERGVVVGHSLGAYIAARLATEHPDRVRAAVLVDGGLPIPGTERAEPQAFLDAFLGPALARLRMRFASYEAYRDWWRAHPALAAGDIEDADLVAYADYDLVGTEPELRSSVSEEAVRADAVALFELGEDARRLTVPATLLCAPRGLQDDPNPMQPRALAREWAAGAPELRRAIEVPDVNHYTIVLGATGARAVAREVATAVAGA
jgi:pimeloyl-ACP methyl ester carboxylesterase